jgi:hypothetical protein
MSEICLPQTTELLKAKLRYIQWLEFIDMFSFYTESLWNMRLLDFDKLVVYSLVLFLVYKWKMLILEDLVIQPLEILLRNNKVLKLGNIYDIQKNLFNNSISPQWSNYTKHYQIQVTYSCTKWSLGFSTNTYKFTNNRLTKPNFFCWWGCSRNQFP